MGYPSPYLNDPDSDHLTSLLEAAPVLLIGGPLVLFMGITSFWIGIELIGLLWKLAAMAVMSLFGDDSFHLFLGG